MTVHIIPFADLSIAELYRIIQLRISVFVVEQNCPYQELDNKDQDSFHLVVYNEMNELVGTLRILPPGLSYAEPSIGRVASGGNYRGKGIGHRMMREAMIFLHEHYPANNIRISAQTYLCDFYAQYGFQKTGKEYLEDGIPHSEMLYTI